MNSDTRQNVPRELTATRRQVLTRLGGGFGGLALAALLAEDGSAAVGSAVRPAARGIHNLEERKPHHGPRAKSVIQLFMHGGPSHVDLLDPKPLLEKFDGTTPPAEVSDDEKRTAYLTKGAFAFQRYGKSELEFADVLANTASHADDIAVVRSMFTEHRNHEQALWMAHTGLIVSGRPTMGSWITYALGSENQDLPGYVVLPDLKGLPVDGIRNWSSGWLPPVYQGTAFRSEGSPVLHLRPSKNRSSEVTRGRFELLRQLNARHLALRPGELELEARISSFELAARMQLSATNALSLADEPEDVQSLYGLDQPVTRSYGLRCLMARRLVERGVRFVQILMHGQPWDTHTENAKNTRSCCAQTDLPIGGLLTDLKRRGLLESTLVLWGGEFGRTPGAELRDKKAPRGHEGRDHHPYGFSVWLAGAGVKGGQVYGATDDFGYRALVNRTQTADLHATILHLLGLDHERLTYTHNGRDERLTDVYEAKVIKPLLA